LYDIRYSVVKVDIIYLVDDQIFFVGKKKSQKLRAPFVENKVIFRINRYLEEFNDIAC
jgi:hypothetical protein